ncbi:MAG: thioredoxin [Bifidobacteriaceae bacterium]|jgi:thioredoxin|nr:thioredoxin [Bifidobacteriaceae bacterium]
MEIVKLTENNFDELVKKTPAIIVDFWAAWCGPCQQFAPIFEKAAAKYSDIQFAKVDVDTNKELSIKNGISSIPTIWAFKNGETIYKKPGSLKPNDLDDIIKQLQ